MISTLAFVHPDAQIGQNVSIEPFAYVDKNSIIGDDTWIGPHATVMEGTFIGKQCKIFPGAVVGAIPQDLKYKGENTRLIVGDRVIIRECCTLNRGTVANNETVIGSNTLLMAYVHVAHDCIIGENCIIANGVNLAGHIHIGDYVILGGMSAVHQFVRIGDHSMIGGGSLVRKDIPPYIKAAREPLAYAGVNSIGLKRRGFDQARVNHIQDIYRILFVKGHNINKALEEVEIHIPESEDKHTIVQFVQAAERGLLKGYNQK